VFNEFDFEYELKKQNFRERNFFDNRIWKSNVRDINGGDNFADFCKEFFEILDEEEYFEN
jgi:hypothetical protein